MKIAFVDGINWDYTPLTPFERPLGGSQSAAVYLARELAARGHAVSYFNSTSTPAYMPGSSARASPAGSPRPASMTAMRWWS